MGVSIGTNGCSAGNGGCVHLCLPVLNGRRSCACASGRIAECLPTIRDGPQSVTAEVLTSVTLRCEVDTKGFDVTVEFIKHGVTVQSKFYASTSQHWFVTAFYTVSSVGMSDGGTYVCTARNSYGTAQSGSGILTVMDTGSCDSFPCQNNGTCSASVNGYNCDCLAGYTDKDCESVFECSSDPCQNGGTCSDLVNGYICDCKTGYTGITVKPALMNVHLDPARMGECALTTSVATAVLVCKGLLENTVKQMLMDACQILV